MSRRTSCGGSCPRKHTLDCGCAFGFVVEALRELDVDAEGVDVSYFAIDHASPGARGHVRQGSLLDRLPRPRRARAARARRRGRRRGRLRARRRRARAAGAGGRHRRGHGRSRDRVDGAALAGWGALRVGPGRAHGPPDRPRAGAGRAAARRRRPLHRGQGTHARRGQRRALRPRAAAPRRRLPPCGTARSS